MRGVWGGEGRAARRRVPLCGAATPRGEGEAKAAAGVRDPSRPPLSAGGFGEDGESRAELLLPSSKENKTKKPKTRRIRARRGNDVARSAAFG